MTTRQRLAGRDLEDRVTASPAWRQLVVACAGDEPRALVAEAVRSRLLDGGNALEDPAAVLAWRVSRLVDSDEHAEFVAGVHDDADSYAFRPPWVPAPPHTMAEGPVGQWGIQQDRLITGRVRELVDQVAGDPPTWAAGIRPRPEPRSERDRWEADVGAVVAYRDQFRITHDADPLGAARVRGHQHQARLTARVAWQRVQDHAEIPDRIPVSANERLRALASSQPRHPVAAGAALRRLKAAQRSSDEIRSYDSGRRPAPTKGPQL